MNFAPGVDMTLLARSLTAASSDVGVATLPLCSIQSPPTVKRMRFFSALCGLLQKPTCRYVAWWSLDFSFWEMKGIVFDPDYILGFTPCAKQPILFATTWFHSSPPGLNTRLLYSSARLFSGSTTAFAIQRATARRLKCFHFSGVLVGGLYLCKLVAVVRFMKFMSC